ncbi:hypothetical protein Taro_045837 [Colocasia esculenta]|uniref:Uncharacterized protein n=1 Tax=Colocasia esculenta TaxID=4460 RepID=A0A843X109_COLES|nr:hypothetical protein [Colocasia esculenta]
MQERIISGRERDEDVEDEVEMYAEYVPDPDVQERLARAQSRAKAWEADQRAAYRVGGGHGHDDDDDDFARLMEGLPRTRSLREAPSQSRRRGSSTQVAAPSQSRRAPTSSQLRKKGWLSGWGSKKGKKSATLVEDSLDIADAKTFDPNAEDDTPSLLDSSRLPNSTPHDLMTTGGLTVDSNNYDTMISDFERMSTQESVGSYGDHSYHPESTSTNYSSGYSGYTATAGYLGPSPYMYPPTAFYVPIPVQVFAPLEDVQMAQLNLVHPGCQMWDHYLRLFRQRYHTMMTWDEYCNFVSERKGYHIIEELPSESDESKSVPSQSQWNAYDPYQQEH